MFDISETRRVLLQRRQELLNERDANRLLQKRFDLIAKQLHGRSGGGISSGIGSEGIEDEEEDDGFYGLEQQANKKEETNDRSDDDEEDTLQEGVNAYAFGTAKHIEKDDQITEDRNDSDEQTSDTTISTDKSLPENPKKAKKSNKLSPSPSSPSKKRKAKSTAATTTTKAKKPITITARSKSSSSLPETNLLVEEEDDVLS